MKQIVSFVHGYTNLKKNIVDKKRPSLVLFEDGKKPRVFNYFFPRTPGDFNNIKFSGAKPFKDAKSFSKMPRYGFTGLSKNKTSIFCGSWNSIFEIDIKTYELKNIITNNLMNNLHGICVDKKKLFFTLSSNDTVVICNLKGKIIDYFSITRDLNVIQDKSILKKDWRFESKQQTGSTGYFHFNYVTKIKNTLWLTSRNLNCFILVNLKKKKASLKTMNLSTPALIHDGVHYKGQIFLTSIDGKIIVANEANNKVIQQNRHKLKNLNYYNRDLITKIIRLSNILKREPNWCRGIKIINQKAYVLIDGRYDTQLKFSLLKLDMNKQKMISIRNFNWKTVASIKSLRYCTGFDLLI